MGQIGKPEKEVWAEPLENPVPKREWEPEKTQPPQEAPMKQPEPERVPVGPGKSW